MHTKTILLGGLVGLAGCVAYESKPIDWTSEAERCESAPRRVEFSVEEVRIRAVAFDPEVNALRLKRAASQEKAVASGWWEDPELNVDFLRVLQEPHNPWVYGGSLAFTLPLSGVPELEKKAAEAYSAADYWEVVAAESKTAGEAAVNAVTARELGATIAEVSKTLAATNYLSALEVAGRLVEVGELARSEFEDLHTVAAEWRRNLIELAHEQLAAENALAKRLLLPPGCTYVWKDVGETSVSEGARRSRGDRPTGFPSCELSVFDFTNAPVVRAAVARLGGNEKELEREIRRQYPEPSFGPAYTREDGYNRVGLTAGLTLPLWNRNRVGIAAAKGARDVARQEAIDVWRAAVWEWQDLKVEYEKYHAKKNDIHVMTARRIAEMERLYEIGELDAAGYIAAVHRRLNEMVGEMRRRIDAAVLRERMKTVADALSLKGAVK